MEITFRFCSSLWRIFYCVTITLFICLMCLPFLKTLELRYIFVRSNYVWKWHENYISFLLVIVIFCYVTIVIYLFDVVALFNDVRNRFYFGTFKLRMDIKLQLRFVFAPHCNIFFITSQLRYLFVRCSYVFWWRSNYVVIWYVRITYGN